MYEIEFYRTDMGNVPFEKYLEWLMKHNKRKDAATVDLYLKMLRMYGADINKQFKPNAIKHLRDGVYELRPVATRVFFFFFTGQKIIVLHAYEKKTNTTDPEEIRQALKEMKDYRRGYKNGEID